MVIIIILLIFPIDIYDVIFFSEINASLVGPYILGNSSSNDDNCTLYFDNCHQEAFQNVIFLSKRKELLWLSWFVAVLRTLLN